MRKVLTILFVVVLLFGTASVPVFADDNGEAQPIGDGIDKSCEGTVLTVFNWGEYIADGSDGSMDVIAEFEKETGIKVKYITYANNEELYAALNAGGTTYDIVVPSDYMFERLYSENFLQPIDLDNIYYYKNIAEKYKNIYPDENMNKYYVPYTIGTVGVIYNSTMVDKSKCTGWDLLWDPDYAYQILMFDNPRDAFAIAQFKLGLSINSIDRNDWELARDELIKQKEVIKRYVNDEIFDIMENGYAAVAPYYAGDFLTMKAENNNLEFYYPRNDNNELNTNQFIDVMCITKASKNKKAAEMFINFILREDIAIEVAEYISYASPNVAVVNNPEYCYSEENNKYAYDILYPEELNPNSEEKFKANLMFSNLNDETLKIMNDYWASVKAQADATGVYLICGCIVLLLILLIIFKLRKKRIRRIDDEYYSLS